jgi:hypothetical protein
MTNVMTGGDTPVVTMPPGRTALDVTWEPLKVQLENIAATPTSSGSRF